MGGMADPLPPGLDEIRLYDTRTREVRPLEPVVPGRVAIYTCGPTVYAPQTLGNMRSQLTPDVLRRLLIMAGFEVTFITNITDVGHLVSDADEGEDKLERAAAASGESAADIAQRFTTQWSTDRLRLGCLEPDLTPRAADHIAEQIGLVEILAQQGHTYVIADGVYFDVSTFPRYADFAGLRLEDLESTGRADTSGEKRHPADFALWKLTPPGVHRQQEWDSPWGRGFPGWHIECSAMATKYLGPRFDLHTGGIDHVRVHHTNEIAQSECALEVHPWVGHWVHTEFLDLSGRKISKSAGDVLLVDSLVDRGIDPLAFRYFILQGHYRQKLDFSFEAVEAAGTALRRLRTARAGCGDPEGSDPERLERHRRRFFTALADDLNTPRAIAVLWEAIRSDDLTPADRAALLDEADRVLAFGLHTETAETDQEPDERVDALMAERDGARTARDWAESDRIRDELAAEGIDVVDTPTGSSWHRR